MKIYVFGFIGMLGRYVYTYLKQKNYDVVGVSRNTLDASAFNEQQLQSSLPFIGIKKGDVIINCMGAIKPQVDKLGVINAIKVNSLFPHYLSNVCEKEGYKMIHITTDCFLPDTKILTKNGYINIQDLNINDNVYTHTGNIKNVYECLPRYIKENIYSIKTLGNDVIKCTKNHPWFAIKREWREKFNFSDIDWIKTEDLEIGNLIAIPKLEVSDQTINRIDLLSYSLKYKNQINEYNIFLNNIKNKTLNIKEFCYSNNLNYKKIIRWNTNKDQYPKVYKLKNTFEINEETSWLLGLFLAEGWVDNTKHRKTITITLGDEPNLINKSINIIKKYLKINPNFRYMKTQKGCQITFTHQLLSEMISKDFYINEKHYSHTKKIPYWINDIGKENIVSFLKGYFDGDGCFFEDEKKSCFCTMSSVSEVLIDELKILFMKLGVLPNKTTHHNNGRTKICKRDVNIKTKFILTISGQQTEKILNIFNIDSKYFNNINRYNRFFENDTYWFIPITEITEEYYEGPVYNLEVEDDHSYLVNGGLSAHNCVFSGDDGNYNEKSPHDCTDVYGKTKSLGEPENCTVIRSSIIGEEVGQTRSLIEWVKSMKDKSANGYINHKWNGVTCLQMAKIFEDIIANNKYWKGTRHIFSPNTVNKYELVQMISDAHSLNVNLTPVEGPTKCDRSLSTIYDDNLFNIPDLKTQIEEQFNYFNKT